MPFNLPFSVKISNTDPTDDRALTANAAAKNGLIDGGRAYNGLLTYQQDTEKLYMLDDITTSGWTAMATEQYVINSLTGVTTSLAGLSDTTITSPQNNDILLYSGSTWGNVPYLWKVVNSGVTLFNDNYNLVLSTIEIPDDSGIVTLVDMGVTSASTGGTENSYAFKMDGSDVLRIYSESDGTGSVSESSVVVDGDYHYMGNPTTNGTWRWFVNGDGDLEFQKRITGSWVYKTKFT